MSRIIFFGSSEFSVFALRALIEANIAILVVITVPDKPAGRGKKMDMSPVKKYLTSPSERDRDEVSILQPEKLDSDFLLQITNLKLDIGVVASYGKIIPKALLDLFPCGVLNIHPSLLPLYRGASPLQSTILNGDTETGVTIMLVDEKMDHGPILTQKKFDITNYESSSKEKINLLSLHDELAKLGAELLLETLSRWLSGKIVPMPQDELHTTFTKMIKKEDGLIDWSKSPEHIERMVRAYNPWPGTYTKLKSGKTLKIKKVEIINGELKLLVVQPEGKKEMPGDAYLRGNKNIFEK